MSVSHKGLLNFLGAIVVAQLKCLQNRKQVLADFVGMCHLSRTLPLYQTMVEYFFPAQTVLLFQLQAPDDQVLAE